MSWDRIKATGVGQLMLRLEVHGWPYEFVTHNQLEKFLPDGRRRVQCLEKKGYRWSELFDPPQGEVDGKAPTFRFYEPGNGLFLANMLAPQATTLARLQRTVDDSDVLFTVTNVSGWDGNGVVHIGTEVVRAINITSTTPGDTATVGISERGLWGTEPHAHFGIIHQSINAASPAISDQPFGMEGRICRIHAYGEGDDPQGDGTQIWMGFALTEPRSTGDGKWEFPGQMIHERLDEDSLVNAGEDIGLRGVTTEFVFTVDHSSPIGSGTTAIRFGGFWETQADFITDLNLALDSLRTRGAFPSSWTGRDIVFDRDDITGTSAEFQNFTEIAAEELTYDSATGLYNGKSLYFANGPVFGRENDYAGRYRIKYNCLNSDNQLSIRRFGSFAEPYFNENGNAYVYNPSGAYIGTMPQTRPFGATYIYPNIDALIGTGQLVGSGLVPRYDGTAFDLEAKWVGEAFGSDKMYLATLPTVAPDSRILALRYENSDDGVIDDAPDDYEIDYGNVTVPSIVGGGTASTPYANSRGSNFYDGPLTVKPVYGFPSDVAYGPSAPELILPGDFFERILDESRLVSADVLPPLYHGILEEGNFTANAYTEDWKKRTYFYTEPITFLDLIRPVLQMHKRALFYNNSGQLSLRILRDPRTYIYSHTLLAGDIVGTPKFERSGILGAISEVRLEQNFNPFTGDSISPKIRIRNQAILDTVGTKKTMDITWPQYAGLKGETADATQATSEPVPVDADIADFFAYYFELFGLETFLVEATYTIEKLDVEMGDVVRFSSDDVDNPTQTTGKGCTNVGALVLGKVVNLDAAEVTLRLLTTFSAAVDP